MAALWYATGRIYFDFVLAYNTGDIVPDTVVDEYELISAGAVSVVRTEHPSGQFLIYPHIDYPAGETGGGDGVSSAELDILTRELVIKVDSATRAALTDFAAGLGTHDTSPGTLMRRDPGGNVWASRFVSTDATVEWPDQLTRKDYVDSKIDSRLDFKPVTDWNTEAWQNGFYQSNDQAANRPPDDGYWMGRTESIGFAILVQTLRQIAFTPSGFTSPKTYRRLSTETSPGTNTRVWGPWERVLVTEAEQDGNLGTYDATPDTVMRRNGAGGTWLTELAITNETPFGPQAAVRKDYVDNKVRSFTHAPIPADYTLDPSDEGKMLYAFADAVVTVAATADVNFPFGGWVDIARGSDPPTLIKAAQGVTLLLEDGRVVNNGNSFPIRSVFGIVRLQRFAENSWFVTGDYETVTDRAVREATPDPQWLQIVRRDGAGHAGFSKITLHDTADLAGHHAARRDYVDGIGTYEPNPDTVMRRSGGNMVWAGRFISTDATTEWGDQLTRKDYVDNVGSTDGSSANNVVRRNHLGDVGANRFHAQASAPESANELTRKDYVDSRIWRGTQAEYDALPTKDDTVLYVIRA